MVEPLTARQREILALLAAGMQYPDIAARVYISRSSVKNHCTKIYQALGAVNAAQAVAIAYERGIFVPDILSTSPPDGFRVALVPWQEAS